MKKFLILFLVIFYCKKEVGIPLKIKIRDFNKNPSKEIIIVRDSIVDYSNFEFTYPKLNKRIDSNIVVFSNLDLQVSIKKVDFKEHKSFIKSDYEGFESDIPLEIISSVDLLINNKLKKIKDIKHIELTSPNFESINVFQIDTNNLVLQSANNDGMLGYLVYIFINKSGESKQYIVYP